jgi:ribonuclease HI
MSRTEKLVRDLAHAGIPATEMRSETNASILHRLLQARLDEEITALRASRTPSPEQFAEVIEVLNALAALGGHSPSVLEGARLTRHAQRGGYAKGMVWAPAAPPAPVATEGTPTAASLRIPVPPANTAHVYADGGSAPNPGPGGWGAVVVLSDGTLREVSGGEIATTNNCMELMAAAAGLREAVAAGVGRIVMRLDSKYVQDGTTSWIHGWKRKGWKTASGSPVKNQELWQALDAEVSAAKTAKAILEFEWVKGHSGNPGNERADQLVGLARAKLPRRR